MIGNIRIDHRIVSIKAVIDKLLTLPIVATMWGAGDLDMMVISDFTRAPTVVSRLSPRLVNVYLPMVLR